MAIEQCTVCDVCKTVIAINGDMVDDYYDDYLPVFIENTGKHLCSRCSEIFYRILNVIGFEASRAWPINGVVGSIVTVKIFPQKANDA